MKKGKQLVFIAGWLMMTCFVKLATAQTTVKEINKWYNSHAWLHGIDRKPSPTINKAEFAKQYKAHQPWWDSAFAYLKQTDPATLKPGRYTLYGNDDVYVNVTETSPKNKEDVLFEAHKEYADIHCVVSGEEQIGIAPYASAVLKKEYDPAKDIAFYTTSDGKYYLSGTSTLFIMFPEQDAHCGGIKTNESSGTIKKIVVKVRTTK
jgi:biofilm protein TabA